MPDPEKSVSKVYANNNSNAVGNISAGGDISGNIHVGNIGYSSEDVAKLLAQIASTFQAKPFDGTCPYKGLDVFEEEDAELFFGREKLVEELVRRVKESRTVFITGPSGSGKSSLVRAGLIPALKQGKLKGSDRWLYATMKPGRDPFEALGRAVSHLAGTTNAEDEIRAKGMKDASIFTRWCEILLKDGREKRFVLFIDQFEEVFTQVSKEEERVAFLNLLTHAADAENGRVILLFSMRSDFVPNCAAYPELNATLNRQFIQIGAMQPDELVSAIAQPALRVGLRIGPDLIAQIINDMKGEPGALPLMSFALKDLFEKEQTKGGIIALTLSDYFDNKGINEALQRHADAALAQFNDHEKKLAQSIFSGLIEIGRGTQDTKRTALFSELIPTDSKPDEVKAVVQKLADARLVTTEEGSNKYTITHEKLIDAWPWLKKLINENRDVIALQNEIAEDAKEWEEHQRDASYLYSGARLANAHEQLKSKQLVVSGTANDFLKTGFSKQQREQYIRILSISGIVSLIIAGVVFFSYITSSNANKLAAQSENFANTQVSLAGTAQANAEEAQRQATIARLGELAAQSVSLRDKGFLISLLLSAEAFNMADGKFNVVQLQSALLDNTQTNPQLDIFLSGHSDNIASVAFSPDGKTLASGSSDNTIILWDVETRQAIGQPLSGHFNYVTSVAFSPDGKTLASGSGDNTIILWDVETHKAIGQPLSGHSLPVLSVAFSPDGKTLASGSRDSTIILWNVKTRQAISQPLRGHSDSVDSVAFSPDGKTLASGSWDKTIILWDVETRKAISEPVRGHSLSITSVAFSPDSKTLASGSGDNTIILWDVETHKAIGQPLSGHSLPVLSVAFSPDGKTLASGSGDNTIILWDVETHQTIGQPLSGHTDSVREVAFSPDGKTLASGSNDSTIILWDVATYQIIGQPLSGHSDYVTSLAFSPDGKTLASGSWDSTIILWDVATYQTIGQPLSGYFDYATSVAFSPDGKTLASGGIDNTIILWDVETRQIIGQPLSGHSDSVDSVAFSPDGKTLASGSGDNTIILWDVDTHQAIGQPLRGHSDSVDSVAFSPDGKTLASGSGDNTIILWDVDTHQAIGQPLSGHSDSIVSVAFSPDGKTLASGSWDKTIILWDVETREAISQPLSGHSDTVASIAFSPDGLTLASGGIDNTIILWDVETQQAIGQPLSGHSLSITSVAFSPDGKTLASGSDDGTIILWDIDPQSWKEKSCARAGRNFTRAEWRDYFPNEGYRKTCDQWPLEPDITLTPTAIP